MKNSHNLIAALCALIAIGFLWGKEAMLVVVAHIAVLGACIFALGTLIVVGYTIMEKLTSKKENTSE